jgi:RNA polymerase sigma-70 factor (ECF subfamily)
MSDDSSFDELVTRFQDGSQSAATELFDRYASRLVLLARRRLGDRLRPRVDPEDVVQSAFRSFFVGNGEKKFDIQDPDALWGLLTVITLRKCSRQIERYYASRRDIRREFRHDNGDDSTAGMEFFAQEPRPEEAAVLAEIVERIIADLEPREREILTQHLQGADVEEIAQNISRSTRTVERVLERVRRQLQDWSKEV